MHIGRNRSLTRITMAASPAWHTLNNATIPSPAPSSDTPFTLTTPPKTDLWRRHAADNVFTAPILYRKLPRSHLQRVEVSVFAPWRTQFDQGGLVLIFPPAGASPDHPLDATTQWIKAGIEFFNHAPVLAVVGTDRCSDWSLAPMDAGRQSKARLAVVREGATLWVHGAQAGGEMRPLREIKWALLGEDGREMGPEDEREVWVGVYAAKPTLEENDKDESVGLEVSFSDWKLEVEE